MDIHDCELRRTTIGDGIEIHYAEAGEGDTIVFVHGGLGDWTSWAPQWPLFSARFRCITYSRRFSWPNRNVCKQPDHSVFDEAEDLAALLATWNVHDPIVVGTSYGAYTALQLALKTPAGVRALALTEPPVLPLADLTPGGREVRREFQVILTHAKQAYGRGEVEEAVRILTFSINGNMPQPATSAEGLRKRMLNAYAMQVLCGSARAYPGLDTEQLKRLELPTLLMSGANTQPIHQAIFRSLTGLLPSAQIVHVEDAGHGVHRDNPDAFNELLMRFIEHLPALR